MRLVLNTGRCLEFIPTPYLHFAGSFVSYDEKEKLLFSSDLFGAFSHNRTFYADDSYMDKMLSFHELYMPSNSVLRPIMDILLSYPIDIILPQHGSIIRDRVMDYIHALRTLECGSMLAPLRKNLMKSGGYLMIFNEVYRRLRSLYPFEEVCEVFRAVPNLIIDESCEVRDYHSDGEAVWNEIFEAVRQQKGMGWITVMEPFVRNLCAVYDLTLPDVFSTTLNEMASENDRLKETNIALDQTVKAVNDKLVKCPVTGLYNEAFFRSLLEEELMNEDWSRLGDLVSISVDNFTSYQMKYGVKEGHNVLNNLAYMLQESFGDCCVFRMEFTEFALYVKGFDKSRLIEKLEEIRIAVSKSNFFLGDLTISGGVAFRGEIRLDLPSYEKTADEYLKLSLTRQRIAKKSGKNMISWQGEGEQVEKAKDSVLVVDSDETNLALLKNFISEEGISVLIARDGVEAYELVMEHKPKVVVSEVILNKVDGFVLREQILQNSETKDIETILLSYKKDEESVERALDLGITYYLKKPYILSELVGIVRRKVKGNAAR
jgi:diguanylate cyclase (GGDEF)-like protein